MKAYPHTSTQRKQVCLKTHSLAPRACMPIVADRLGEPAIRLTGRIGASAWRTL